MFSPFFGRGGLRQCTACNDPFCSGDCRYYRGYGRPAAFDPFHRQQQQQQEEERRRREYARQLAEQQAAREAAAQKQAERLAEKNRKARLRELQLRAYVRAATKIQRTWRAHHERAQAQRRAAAATVIRRALLALPRVHNAQQVARALRSLREVRQAVLQLQTEYDSQPQRYSHRDLLMLQDQLERKILSMDDIDSHGSAFVRAQRKSNVELTQSVLRHIDAQLRGMQRAATAVQRWFRRVRGLRQARRQHAAAVSITHFLRRLPAVLRAKQTRRELQQLATARRDFVQLKQNLQDQLAALLATLSTEPQPAADDGHHKRKDLADAAAAEDVLVTSKRKALQQDIEALRSLLK
eukprot:m.129513 g.129513  ORF g.129513 m.129513 type:complete len:353 (+) comp19949_c2_seq1:110-1168(+)